MTMTVQEAAKRLGVSIDSIKRRIYSGEIKADKVGKSWVIDDNRFEPELLTKESIVEDISRNHPEIFNGWRYLEMTRLLSPEIFNVLKNETLTSHELKSTQLSNTHLWKKFIGTLKDGVDIFKNGFKPDELIILSDGKLNLPACFNSKGHGGVYELPPYSPNDFKYADFNPTHWSKWLEIPKVKL